MDPHARKEQILNIAIDLSIEKGHRNLTRRAIANKMQCASALINHYFDSIENLKHIVLQAAVEKEIVPILAENFVSWGKEHPELPTDLKDKVIQYLTN